MLSLLIFIACITTLPCGCWTFSTQYCGNAKHPSLPNYCLYEELGLSVPLNETIYPTDIKHYCIKVSCRHDYVLIIKHCDRYMLGFGCKAQPPDYTKPYPDCCPEIKCGVKHTNV